MYRVIHWRKEHLALLRKSQHDTPEYIALLEAEAETAAAALEDKTRQDEQPDAESYEESDEEEDEEESEESFEEEDEWEEAEIRYFEQEIQEMMEDEIAYWFEYYEESGYWD